MEQKSKSEFTLINEYVEPEDIAEVVAKWTGIPVKRMLESEKENGNIKNYNYESDTDVFDSCGLGIYYLSICWVDNNDELHIAGSSYYSS